MIIKVCGLRKPDNVRAISALDVDWIGLVFWSESPRYVQQVASRGGFYPDYSSLATKVAELGGMPEEAHKTNKPQRVGVFVDDMPQSIVTRVFNYNLDLVQLHGEEEPVMIENLKRTLMPDIRPVKIIKTIMVKTADDLLKCKLYENHVDFFLFHTSCEEKGGTGESFDWNILQAYDGKVPFLISGGIGPDDVEKIKAFKHPQFVGIDINSKFETDIAIKDVEAVDKFVKQLKA